MPFRSNLDVSLIDFFDGGRQMWRVDTPLVYYSKKFDREVMVPAGFHTDFASVPRWPLAHWLTADCAHAPAVIHDYLYVVCPVNKATADAIFLEAMEDTGVSWWRRKAMYGAVRLGGRGNFNKETPA